MKAQNIHIPARRLLVLCAVAIVIAVIGVAAYKVTNRTDPDKKITPPANESSIQTITSSLRSSLLAMYTYLYWTPPSAQTTIGYQLPGDSFQVLLPGTSPGTAFGDTNNSNEQTTYSDLSRAAAAVNGTLLQNGFTAVTSQDQTSGLLDSVYFYKRADAVCQVSVYTQLELICAPMSQLATTAAEAKPLVAIYNTAESGSGTALVSAPTIRSSETAGYMIATLPIYNNHGETDVNFYKQGTGVWQMVDLDWYNDPHEDADITPNCADFESNTQISAAFAGQTCYDSATDTTSTVHD